MSPLPCRTVAGRHAADRQRNRRDPQRIAVETLWKLLCTRPLRTAADLSTRGDRLPTIALKIRLDYFGLDYVFVEAALHDLGWRNSVTELSRRNSTHDVRVLEHQETGARLLLLIALPHGELEHVEAA